MTTTIRASGTSEPTQLTPTRTLRTSYHRRATNRGHMRTALHCNGRHYVIDALQDPHGDWIGFVCDPLGTWAEPVAGPDLASCEREARAVLGGCV